MRVFSVNLTSALASGNVGLQQQKTVVGITTLHVTRRSRHTFQCGFSMVGRSVPLSGGPFRVAVVVTPFVWPPEITTSVGQFLKLTTRRLAMCVHNTVTSKIEDLEHALYRLSGVFSALSLISHEVDDLNRDTPISKAFHALIEGGENFIGDADGEIEKLRLNQQATASTPSNKENIHA